MKTKIRLWSWSCFTKLFPKAATRWTKKRLIKHADRFICMYEQALDVAHHEDNRARLQWLRGVAQTHYAGLSNYIDLFEPGELDMAILERCQYFRDTFEVIGARLENEGGEEWKE